MSILKFENRTPRTLREMYAYLTDPMKTDAMHTFGIGVNAAFAVDEMEFIQLLYCREHLTHPYVQAIFAFDEGIFPVYPDLMAICMEIGQCLVCDSRQMFGAIHYKGGRNLHCHYMINYVGVNGFLYHQWHTVQYYQRLVNGILGRYGLERIRCYRYDALAG